MKLISVFMLAALLASTPALAQRHGGGYAGVIRGGPVYGVRTHIPVGHAVWPGYRTVYPYRYPYRYRYWSYLRVSVCVLRLPVSVRLRRLHVSVRSRGMPIRLRRISVRVRALSASGGAGLPLVDGHLRTRR